MIEIGDLVFNKSENRQGVVMDIVHSWTFFQNGKRITKKMKVYIVQYDSSLRLHSIAHKSNLLKKIKASA